MNRTLLCLAILAAPLCTAGQDIDFGEDSSPWANDGECDDPRFDGPGTADTLVDGDLLRDAADCLMLFERGEVWLRGDASLIVAGQDIDFGDDSGNYPNDGECDDLRFEGPGAYTDPLEEDVFRDASDCLALFDSGQVWLAGDGPDPFGALAIGEDLGYGGIVSAVTQAEADDNALSECGSVDSDCSIVARFGPDTCVAIARDEGAGLLGWATGPDSQETADEAIDECMAGGGSVCTVGDFACNGGADSTADGSERFAYATGEKAVSEQVAGVSIDLDTPEWVHTRQPGETFSDTLNSGGQGPEMVVIPPGRFRMGCVSGQGCSDDELPVHDVTIAQTFAVSKYEVTFEDYDRYTYPNRVDDEGWGRGRRPVFNVSWNDAQDYVEWLSAQTGHAYRLLSEAEWEYVARAGSSAAYSWGDDIGSNRANCLGCGSQWDFGGTAPVGSLAANAFGVHDMHGNVWEWVEDCWNDSYAGAPTDGSAWRSGACEWRVLRGGSWYSAPTFLRSAHRYGDHTGSRQNVNGFRVARTLTP